MAYWLDRIEQIASCGQRPLAVASKRIDHNSHKLSLDDVQGGLALLGLVGIVDPPRGEAINAVLQCQAAGIRVKMITGDHVMTARSIGVQIGIGTVRQP